MLIGYEIKFIFLKFRVQCLTHPNSPSGFPVSVAIRLSNLIGGSVLFAIDLYPFHLYLLHRFEISVYSCLFFDVVKLIKRVIQSTTFCYLFDVYNFLFFSFCNTTNIPGFMIFLLVDTYIITPNNSLEIFPPLALTIDGGNVNISPSHRVIIGN